MRTVSRMADLALFLLRHFGNLEKSVMELKDCGASGVVD